jgi:single-strand DNA-binding protein
LYAGKGIIMLNKVMLIGRLGADPEIKYAQSGTPVANLRIATDESYTDRNGQRQDRTEWHTVIAFQRTAEICQQYLHKGSLVYIEGKLQTRKWQDKNGQDRYSTEIRVDRLQMLERRQEGNAPAQQSAPQQAHEEPGWEEVPF